MKAIVWTKYGPADGLQLREVETQVPRDNEVRIKIYATTVTAGDIEVRSLKIPFLLRLPMRIYVGPRKPKRITILGQELAGEIESVGKNVTRFKEGDPVFAATGFGLGAYAQYKCLPEDPNDAALAIKPTNMSYEEAAAVPVGALEALHFLRRAKLQKGERLLINGAGGSIGTFGLQIAKHMGAEVTGVDSDDKLEMLRSIGAEQVIDYRQEDFTKNGQRYDVIFDVVGKSPFARSVRSLAENGRYLLANPRPFQVTRGRWVSARSSKKVITGAAPYKTADLVYLRELIEAGAVKSIIDRHFPLDQTAEAHRYVETGRKKGNVVITVSHDEPG